MVSIKKSSKVRSGWKVESCFQIELHERDKELLKLLQVYFKGIGKITTKSRSCCKWRVYSLDDILNYIIPHFDKYPLITQKFADYLLFKHVNHMRYDKKHLTTDGLLAIVNIRGATLNWGLTTDLKKAFPMYTPVNRPRVENSKIPHLNE